MNVLVKFGRIWCLPGNFREYVVRDVTGGREGWKRPSHGQSFLASCV